MVASVSGQQQRTLAAPTAPFLGVGLHSGSEITMRLLPAEVNSGITFIRTDRANATVRACTANVSDTLLATTLSDGDTEVATVEHLLSALCACGVDNICVELDGAEVPIMDGSACPFVTIIRDSGLVEQAAPKQYWLVTKPVRVEFDDGRSASFEPHPLPRWDVRIDFDLPVVRCTPQQRSFELSSNAAYLTDIARARTFGFMEDFDMMRENNRALGGSLATALVLDRTEVINEEGLRQPDEFIAHKLLDAIGDCYIDSHVVLGRYVATRPGHALNHSLMERLLACSDCYETVTAAQLSQLPDFGPLRAVAL